jgi:hypothetical protein
MAKRFAAEGARLMAGDWKAACLDAAVPDIRRCGAGVGPHGDLAKQAAAVGGRSR